MAGSRLQQFSSTLGPCSTVAELRAGAVVTGRMSFCMVAYRPHYFILLEEGTYKGNEFKKKDGGKQFTFSYVPESVVRADRYGPKENKFREGAMDPSSLDGYNPFTVSKSYIFDSWKFTNDYLRLYSVPITNWRFKDYNDKFNRYNVLAVVPFNGITDCIGYSGYQIYHRADAGGRLRGDESFDKFLQEFIDMGFIKSYGQ
jgi:hypothetical protein